MAQVVVPGVFRLIFSHITGRKRDYKLPHVEWRMCRKIEKTILLKSLIVEQDLLFFLRFLLRPDFRSERPAFSGGPLFRKPLALYFLLRNYKIYLT